MPDVDPTTSCLPLSEDEHKVLALYDRLQELRLEIAIINAQARQTGLLSACPEVNEYEADNIADDKPEASVEEVNQAQNEMMEARAKYMLRSQVVEAVMTANPILKAVHSGRDATVVER